MKKTSESSAKLPTGNQSTSRSYSGVVVAPRYSAVSGRLRRYTSGPIQCSLFCGGSKCKYENERKWTEKDVAIPGLYSHWITDKVLAMARPSTMLIKEKNLIDEFKRVGIQSVFNLQQPGEHKNCGPGIEESSGFSYLPEQLMSEGLFFYNYGWEDYGVPSIVNLLDMVKVFKFAVDQGKVAVHCHAGLGRTGILIACYLIFSRRITADEAVCHVRSKRPGSIQSPAQLQVVQHFYHYLRPKWIVFPLIVEGGELLSLEQFMSNQRCILHGADYRCYKYQPKIVCDICGRILDLCGVTTQFPWRTANSGDHNDSMLEDLCKSLSGLELRAYLGGVSSESKDHVITSNDVDDDKELEVLLSPSKGTGHKDGEFNETVTQSLKHNFIQNDDSLDDAKSIAVISKIKTDINTIQSTNYTEVLSFVSDVTVLLYLLLSWLDELKDPLLSQDDIAVLKRDHKIQLYQNGILKEKAATLQVLSSTVQELAYQIAPADGVQQFVHQLSCSLIGCNRTVTIPNEATNKIKQHRDSSIPSPSHSVKTHKYDSSIGVEDDNQIIFNLLLNQH